MNREAAKILALSSEENDKCSYFAGKEILPLNQCQMIEHAKLANSLLGKALEKQIKKQVDTLKSLNFFNKINELKQIGSNPLT